MMKIEIITKSNNYDVVFGRFEETFNDDYLPCDSGKCLIVTDETVFSLYENRIISFFKNQKFSSLCCILEPGEINKSMGSVIKIIHALGDNDFSRKDFIVSIGGGVISDIAGFAASIYRRGIDYFTIPTTLLSMVDASVGGKTGIDTSIGKNSVGTFYQPKGVFIDTSFLKTLDKKETANGMAEIIKCSIISGIPVENDNETNIVNAIHLKADIVARDERDEGIRHILNLGHTLGHALERATGYNLSHGEAVSIGLSVMAENIDECLVNYGLPTKKWLKETPNVLDHALEFIGNDKKCISGGMIEAVFVKEIGDCYIRKVAVEEFKNFVRSRI